MAVPQSAIYGIIAAGVVVFLVGGVWYLYPRYHDIDTEAQQYQENKIGRASCRERVF